MMDLNIPNTKIELIQWLTTLEDENILKRLIEFRQSAVYQLSEAEERSIDEGLEDLKNGNVVPHDEVKKTYEKWL